MGINTCCNNTSYSLDSELMLHDLSGISLALPHPRYNMKQVPALSPTEVTIVSKTSSVRTRTTDLNRRLPSVQIEGDPVLLAYEMDESYIVPLELANDKEQGIFLVFPPCNLWNRAKIILD